MGVKLDVVDDDVYMRAMTLHTCLRCVRDLNDGKQCPSATTFKLLCLSFMSRVIAYRYSDDVSYSRVRRGDDSLREN